MYRKHLPFTLLLAILLSSFLLNGCRNEPKETTTEVTATGPVTVVSRLRAEPDRLCPFSTARAWSIQVFAHLYLPLVESDPQTVQLAPVLAKSLPTITPITEGPFAGGYKYAYEIHDQAVWSNGSPVQASDYVFTVKLIDNPKITGITAAYRDIVSFIRDVEVDPSNPKKFSVVTDKAYLDGILATGFHVLPEYLLDPEGLLKEFSLSDLSDPKKAADLAEKDPRLTTFAELFLSPQYANDKEVLQGCGAYYLQEWEPTQRLVLKKKKDWWGSGMEKKYPMLSAYPEELVFKIVPDQNAAITMAKEEGIDVLASIPVNSFLELKENALTKEKFNFFTPPSTNYNYIGINNRSPKLREKEVRLALAYLLNVEEINKTVYSGMAAAIAGPVLPFYDFADKALKPVPFNVDKAKELLKNSGWADSNGNGIVDKTVDGKREELNLQYLITPGNDVSNNSALIFRDGARKAGVNIEIVMKEPNQMREDRNTGQFELYGGAHGLQPGSYDPYQHWHTASSGNYHGFGNAATDALIDELRVTVDKRRQDELYLQIQKILYEEQPIIFINNPLERIMINKKFKNAFTTIVSPGYFDNYFHY